MLAMSPNGEATVHVGINDTRMESDQRWCADSIVLPPLRGTDGHSLTISRGTTLLIDRSRTPTRMTEPDSSNGGPWFSDPTVLTLLEGASVLVEERGKLQLKNGATVHLLPGSELVLEKESEAHCGTRFAYRVAFFSNDQREEMRLEEVAQERTTDRCALIRSNVLPFTVIDERTIDHPVAAGCRVVAGEVPVAGMLRTCSVQPFDALENQFHF